MQSLRQAARGGQRAQRLQDKRSVPGLLLLLSRLTKCLLAPVDQASAFGAAFSQRRHRMPSIRPRAGGLLVQKAARRATTRYQTAESGMLPAD